MDWIHETFRRLYVRVDGRWTGLPVSARGLFSELLKYVDDDGRIRLGPSETPADTVARVVQAHRSELRRIRLDVAELLADGCLRHDLDTGCLVMPNFTAAQGIEAVSADERSKQRAAAAKRAAEYRARKREERDSVTPVTRDASRDVTRDDVTPVMHDASRARRRAGDAREGSPLPSVPSVPVDLPPPSAVPRDGGPKTALQREYLKILQASPELSEDQPAPDWVRAAARLEAMAMGKSSPSRVRECLGFALEQLATLRASSPRAGAKGMGFVLGKVDALCQPRALEAERDRYAPRLKADDRAAPGQMTDDAWAEHLREVNNG